MNGGLDIAVSSVLDAEVLWHVEFDRAPSRILDHHWPDVPNYGDVTKVDWAQVAPVDILTGGFPCQPFSAAGRRAGEDDERHLWPYVLEAIRALRPKYVLLENVAGLRSIGGWFDDDTPFRCVCGWFGRWGGVHYLESDEIGCGDGHSGGGRYGDEGAGSVGPSACHVRRDVDNAGAEEQGSRSDHDVDGEWSGSGGVSTEDRAAFDPEIGAGTHSVGDRGCADVAGADRQSGSLPMGRGGDSAGAGARRGVDSTERARSGWIDDVYGPVCPACGRCLGDGSSGPVYRSGLGTVYRDLASLGFDAVWTSVRASAVGAPHHRERLFILAIPADSDRIRRRGEGQSSAVEEEVAASVCSVSTLPTNGGGADDLLVLPTPVAQPSGNSPENHLRKKPGRSVVTDLSILVENDLLASGGVVLPTPTGQFLPSPTASDASGGGMHPDHPGRQGHTMQLPDYVLLADEPDRWGKYAPAIHRWEQIVGPAPAPTKPNKNGKPRLNAAFAEWMMGLPAGWVTAPEIGISRAEQLKAIGNGVCPQQAAAALRALFAMPAGDAA